MLARSSSPTDQRQSRLLIVAAVFLFLYSVILTLSPAVREQAWNVSYRWAHWIGFAAWATLFFLADRFTRRQLPDRDPFLLPLAALLSGWGLLTIWRLDSAFGIRQTIWLTVGIILLRVIFYLPSDLSILRRYKYLLLTGGLVLTALTILLGTNPEGYGAARWLGCCNLYLQPSEPLKLLLVVYLSAYLSDRLIIRLRFFPLLLPTIFVIGVAILLLIAQRDLGTASLFILIYTAILYIATGKRRVLIATTLTLILAGIIGYFFIDVVRERISTWVNPWSDPSGHSYQIVQSLLAIANGGMIGRGPGLGSPALVPVAQSDFIFTAIAEETGLLGTTALIIIVSLILARSLRAAFRAPDPFRRLLAAGLAAYLGIQTLLIIDGNLRLLPLTGVTLPFVSYGGSSLLSTFIALGLLLIISNQAEDKKPATLTMPQPYYFMIGVLGFAVIATLLADSWWAVLRGPDLLIRTDNPRLAISDRYVPRGNILDRNNNPIDVTEGQSGTYHRVYLYPELSPITGYIHPTYGQAGLEASLDDYLRGIQGNPESLIWWDHLLYGTPPPGLDVRLSLDLDLQKQADQLLGDNRGAIILMNAQTGEILVMASYPSYDPNKLDEIGASLARDQNAPLINRATQGVYLPGSALLPFLNNITSTHNISDEQKTTLFDNLGFYISPQIRMPVALAANQGEINNLRISPLQMSIAAGTLSNYGIRTAPRIVLAVKTPQQGWIVLPALDQSIQVFNAATADKIVTQLTVQNQPFWDWIGTGKSGVNFSTWYIGGTLPNWKGTPLTVVVLVEGDDPISVEHIGTQLLRSAITP